MLERLARLLGRLLEWVIVALIAATVWFAVSGSPYSDNDPDLSWLRTQLHQLKSGPTDNSLDLSRLNDGDWTIACLFGGYTDPTDRMGELGGWISLIDRIRFFALGTLTLRFGEVKENEVVIAYIDKRGWAEFVFFDEIEVENGEYCIRRPQTTLAIDDYSTDWNHFLDSN